MSATPTMKRAVPAARTTSRGVGAKNWVGGAFGWLWFLAVSLPIYYVVITSLKDQGAYFTSNPLSLPIPPNFTPYQEVLDNNIATYFFNSVWVTVGSVVPIVLFSFMASYAIVRGSGRFLRFTNGLFLMGLAIPIQATIIPIYLMITKMGLYDTLWAVILPSIAFGIPLSVLIMSNFLRDIPNELFESMRLDGLSNWQMMWRLALPLTMPAMVTVAIYNGLNVWNGFLFPLILTQSPDTRVMPLGLWAFQGEYQVNIPAVLAAVVLSTMPILLLYIVGRRQLLSGLTAGIGK
ncbi:carbohydrate ABC transporter permease [Propioniciclava flava]|uniref:ABC transporter permease n=1 Tax=Propioniciclava flava TaxID=2072026 RepID=A0A4Q2EEG0_9ACTN|nr:carbohydrate ABC transporter permease [Propioniciclava flava]RXW31333.1 ABC transporter permease [Propioniciclava flava]